MRRKILMVSVKEPEKTTKSNIELTEFKNRLAVLCLQGGGRGLPRKPRDRHILFKSVTLLLDPKKSYAETEINQQLGQWLAEIGQTVEVDHVTLRRYLVDEGYLERDPAGKNYRVSTQTMPDIFAPDIESLNQHLIIEKAKARREQEKRDHLGKRVVTRSER
jgi:hypothetical protein